MRNRALICAAFAIGIANGANAQATITIINNDGPGEGFNDPAPVSPVAGNSGTTLGQQRLNAFQAAADAWESVVSSPIEITVDAALDSLTPCDSSSGVLGRAGTVQVFRDFSGAPQANTWYPSALANAISGVDNDSGEADIQARFNSNVDNNNACLSGTNWFYGIGVPTPANTISFFDTVKHELAHGLGVQSFVDIVTTGQLLDGRNDTYTDNLHDHASATNWSAMTNAERLSSSVNSGQLHWTGSRVNDCAQHILTAGRLGGHVRMFAPSPVQPGSSVSHFDTELAPDELMEPFATPTSDQRLTDRLLADIGWDVNSPTCGGGIIHNPALSPIVVDHRPQISGIVLHRPLTSPILHPVTTSRIHLIRPSAVHFPPGSSEHFPVGSLGHQPAGSFHGPITSPSHFPLLSEPQHSNVASRIGGFDPSIPIDPFIDPRMDPRAGPFGQQQGSADFAHNPIVSFGHNPVVSGHNPIFSGHSTIISGHSIIQSSHNPIFSGHNRFISSPHSLIESIGHHPILSRPPHSFVSSRFGGLDPSIPINPPFQQQQQQQPGGQGALTHNPFITFGHNPPLSAHNPIISGHNPIFSGHNPFLSGHSPFLSNPHFLRPSFGHLPILSSPPHSVVGSRFDPSGPVVVDPVLPNAGVAVPQGGGIERVPGNRGIRTMPGLPPGDPYTVPTQ